MTNSFHNRSRSTLHWVLRIACAACFIGHGAFGIITKAAWLPYLGFFGIPESTAWSLMPVVGTIDITVGISVLLWPTRAVLAYMAFWGTLTALLRPLTGEGIWEFFERAGNFAVPLALLLLYPLPSVRNIRAWLARLTPEEMVPVRAPAVAWVLRVGTAALLIGHGAFGAIMHKQSWHGYLHVVGVTPNDSLVGAIGAFEILLGLLVLVTSTPALLIAICCWKVGTELLRPLDGEPFWEFVERGGSYAAPLALALLVAAYARPDRLTPPAVPVTPPAVPATQPA